MTAGKGNGRGSHGGARNGAGPSPSFTRPTRLVILLQDLEFGGTQRYAAHLVRNIDRGLFTPELWVLRAGDDMLPLVEEVQAQVRWLGRADWVTPGALVRLMLALVRERPPLLYTLTVVPNIWGRLFGRVARVPVIVSGYRGLYPNQREQWLWRLSDRIICNAHALKSIMMERCGVPGERIAVIPNCVDTERFRPCPEPRSPTPTVLFVGRLVEEKDPLTMVEAFRLALLRNPAIRFEVIGNGRLKDKTAQFIRLHGLDHRITLIPALPDVRPYLRRAHVFVLPSQREASPNVILEAMATGLPVISTRVGGIPELVQDRETGRLIEPKDPQALADAILELVADQPLREAMGAKARERVMRGHTIAGMVNATERILKEVMEHAAQVS